ncbi:non-hydrolyzing UDP-N-acetylglucosamine 2-epimerase [Cecembia rubra]|uniref:UDP-N-acetylglucosamine 2-epimerase (Non-hydrolysing) n=1 Tax=Cecembia rubra TaxID=1485585 RepID=A0A2P8EA07_9BACT|nr:UDP-N-acetylglucosamine 2-epimerase (non-hydrolyzing) [Cecembia rubra]PSL06312.1 UDP-N-acetylglucosamine 2-epimerase (non-hydrolysing) [Cecembia rubra]
MKKLKVMTIVGTRPEIIKLSAIIKKCDVYFEHILVHTGQNFDYSLNQVFFQELNIREPDYYLGVVGNDLGQTMGNVISKSYELMAKVMPDAVLVLGDTNSCLSVISSKRLKIPTFHMEAGNRCKDENLPEEVIRRIVDVTSDVNLCYSENALKYILSSGVRPENTFVVGSPMAEVLSAFQNEIESSNILQDLGLQKNKYILLSAHREENIDIEDNFFSLMNAINEVADFYGLPIIYSCHPRSRKNIELRNFKFHSNVFISNPFGFFDYIKLQKNAFCIISDSGTLPEESAYYNLPAVSLRTSTERPEALEKGVFTIGSISSENIIQAIDLAVKMHENEYYAIDVPAYLDKNVSIKVVKIIQSYTQIINRMVWRKG